MNSGRETINDQDLNFRTFRQLSINGVEIATIKRKIVIACEAIVHDISKVSDVQVRQSCR